MRVFQREKDALNSDYHHLVDVRGLFLVWFMLNLKIIRKPPLCLSYIFKQHDRIIIEATAASFRQNCNKFFTILSTIFLSSGLIACFELVSNAQQRLSLHL